MKIIRWSLTWTFLMLGLRAADVEANVEKLVLPEELYPQLQTILATAVQQSPRMLNRALDLEIAEAGRIQARSNLLPTVGGYANYYEARDTRADLPGRLNVTKIAYNFSINQPLFFWGERSNYAKIGQIQESIARGQYRDGYRLLAQTLRGDYLRLVIQKLVVQRAAFYLEHTRKQLAQEEERLAKKVISEYQISVFRLAAEQAQISSERAQFDLEMAKASFARLSGSPLLATEAIPDAIPVATYHAEAVGLLLADYLGQRELPTIEAVTMRKQMETERLSYNSIKTRLRPKFSLVAGLSQDEQSYTINAAQKYRVNSQYGGFSVNWAIFDSFAAQSAVRVALARRRQMDNDYKDMTERLLQTAQIQAKQLDFSARTMALSDRALVASENNLAAKQDEFKRGLMSEADVSLAQVALYDARLNAFNGRADFLARNGEFLATLAQDPVTANLPQTK
ncbi:MAG: TolC family protein [Opitutaceae bacterium]|nr:TolC family protein [Opitutaceae bacterium]